MLFNAHRLPSLSEGIAREEVSLHSVIISRDSQFIRVFPLQAQTSIGRSPNNDIVLDAAGVSELYLKVVFKGKGGVSTGRLLAAVNRPH